MALIGASNSLGGLAGSNALARLLVVISGDSSPLTNAVRSAEGTLSGFSQKASSIGRTFTRYLTLPLLALSGVAVKMAIDYNAAIARVAGLTPIMEETGMTMDELSQSILDLASNPRITQGPTELANALYFAGSAGLNFSQAMEVVSLSSQAASIGMGDAADISRVLIYAMNAYAGTGLTAAETMDTFTAAIREGTAEPDEMAVALGRLLPITAEAGISIQQVVASVAALTNLGMPVRVATTSLRALFAGLFTPTIEATETLHALNIEAQDLRDVMKAGPIAVFQYLEKATKGNMDALHDIIPTIRGFTAYLGLTGDRGKRYKEIMDEVVNSQGDFNHAMEIFMQTPSFKFQKALQTLQIAAVELGTVMLPVFTDIMEAISGVARAFTKLPSPIKKTMVAAIGLGAAVGPVLQLIGALTEMREITLATGAASGLTTMVPTFRAIATGAIAMAAGVGIAALSLQSMGDSGMNLINSLGLMGGVFLTTRVALGGLAAAANAGALGVNAMSVSLASLSPMAMSGIALAIGGIALAIGYVISKSHELSRNAEQMQDTLLGAATSGETLREALKHISDQDFANDLQRIAEAAGMLDKPVGVALPASISGMATDLGNTLQELKTYWDENAASEFPVENVAAYLDVIDQAARGQGNFAELLEKSNLDLDVFLGQIGDIPRGAMTGEQADQIEREAFALQNMTEVYEDYQQAQRATLYAHTMEGKAVEDLASKYGVSSEYMQSALDDVGLSAWGMSEDVETGFAKAEFTVGGKVGRINAQLAEMQAAIDETAKSISDSLVGSFDLFNKLPQKFKGSTDKMIANTQQWSKLMVDQAVDIRTLMAKGVPLDMIQALVADGPDAVAKFADASQSEIDRAVLAYRIGLGAMDEEILKEGAHQIVKGRDMVGNFVTSMLSRKQLLAGAGAQIVAAVQQGIASGNMKESSLRVIQNFVNWVANPANSHLSKTAGSKVAVTFAQGIASGKITPIIGPKMKAQLIAALTQDGVARTKAAQIATAFVNAFDTSVVAKSPMMKQSARAAMDGGLDGAKDTAGSKGYSAGTSFGAQFAQGIIDSYSSMAAAASLVVDRLAGLWDDSLKNSPRYFSYYMGEKVGDEFAAGLKKGSRLPELQRPSISIYDDMGPRDRARNRGLKLDLDVNLDSRKTARDLEWSYRSRGY